MKKTFRGKYNWLEILISLKNPVLKELFYKIKAKSKREFSGKTLSWNRCAYYALKSYYSTTTIASLVEKLGLL